MQRIAVFSLPEPPVTGPERPPLTPAATWRARWVTRGIGTYEEWNHLRVLPLRDRLLITAGTPLANDWLMEHLDGIAGTVSDEIGQPVPLELQERAVGVRISDDRLWGYRLPEVVVSKSASDWAPHFSADLSKELRDSMARRFERSLRNELNAWGRLPDELDNDEPFLVVSQTGAAHGIPAINPERSGHGKPVSVLARRHVMLLSYWRFEGELYLGPLASLGYGRMIRCQPSDLLDRYTQKALLAVPSTTKELR